MTVELMDLRALLSIIIRGTDARVLGLKVFAWIGIGSGSVRDVG